MMAIGFSRAALAPRALSALLALSTASSCQLVVDVVLEKCESDGDCTRKGGDFANARCLDGACRPPEDGPDAGRADWSCLRSEPKASKPEIVIDLTAVSLQEGKPIAGVTARACSRFDANCATPLQAPVTTDSEGHATLLVPTAIPTLGAGFSGYLLLEAPGYLTVVRTFSRPVVDDFVERALLNLVGELERTASFVGTAQDPTLGTLLVLNQDCQGRPIANATMSARVDDSTALQFFYTVDNIPVTSATQTDSNGQAILFNAPTRSLVVRVSNEGVGQTAEFSATPRAGALTVVGALPDP